MPPRGRSWPSRWDWAPVARNSRARRQKAAAHVDCRVRRLLFLGSRISISLTGRDSSSPASHLSVEEPVPAHPQWRVGGSARLARVAKEPRQRLTEDLLIPGIHLSCMML